MGKITVKATQNALKHILKEMLFSVKEAQNRPSPDFTLYEEGVLFLPYPIHTRCPRGRRLFASVCCPL